ncbi:MAG: NAD-dependent epimerase/dehydratase family protein [bacterium]
MTLYENTLYREDVRRVASLPLPWEKLKGRSLMLSGATGLLGSFLVDVLLEKNETDGLDCTVYALGRSRERLEARFSRFAAQPCLRFIPYDVKAPFVHEELGEVDYILHLASHTHPLQYSTDPIGTITTNVIGLQNMLDFSVSHGAKRFAFASSNEIYGENRGDVEFFDENYCGYINSNTMRAGYPESKRCGEALCQAYRAQKGLSIVIPRFTRSYGPTMLMSDSKAISQFIRKGIAGEDIVLKSAGTQFFSYTYMADAISGLLTVLLCGADGEAYNIAEEHGDITLRDLAAAIAEINGKRVVFDLPDAVERAGYSTATKARLDGHKLMALGWSPAYDIRSGIRRTIRILTDIKLS